MATDEQINRRVGERATEPILGRVAIRKNLATEFPELGAEDALNALLVSWRALSH
jgi:hypothetical protein